MGELVLEYEELEDLGLSKSKRNTEQSLGCLSVCRTIVFEMTRDGSQKFGGHTNKRHEDVKTASENAEQCDTNIEHDCIAIHSLSRHYIKTEWHLQRRVGACFKILTFSIRVFNIFIIRNR